MSTTTTNYGLVKPDLTDRADIRVINSDLDTVDTTLASLAASITGKVGTSTTVNGHALSSNVTVTATDVSLGNCDNTSDANKPVSSATTSALGLKVSKGSMSYNIKDYGVVGDGTTDDTTAAQAAVTAASGSTLVIPRGTVCSLSSPLDIPSNTRVTGGGSLKHKTNTTAFALIIITARTNVVIDDITFDGNITNQSTWNESRSCLYVEGSSNVTVHRCAFRNIIGDGIYIRGDSHTGTPSSGIDVDGCVFVGNNTNRNGVSVVSATDSTIRGSYFYKMAKDIEPGAVDIEPNTSADTIENVIVSGNTFVGGGTPSLQKAIAVNNNVGASCTNIVIADNAIRDVFKYGIAVFGNTSDYTKTQAVISNNTLDIPLSLTASAAIIASSLCEVLIIGNAINSTADIGIKSVGSSFQILDNRIKNCALYGVELLGTTAEFGGIKGNSIENCGTSASGSLGGIHIKASNIAITNNRVASSSGSASQVGLYIESGVKNLVQANSFLGTFGSRSLSSPVAPQVFGHNVYAGGYNSVGGTYPPAAEAWLVGDVIQNPTATAGVATRWVCIVAGTPGTWRAEYIGPPTATSTSLEAVGNAVNTADKYAGKLVFNTTTNKPVYSVGANANSVWNDAVGTLAHTPV